MRRRAFTLLEMILTLGLILLFMSVAVPSLDLLWKRRALAESADNLRTLIMMTRAQAMMDGIRYRVFFPGAPDPSDPTADDDVDLPEETLQPLFERQADPLNNPERWEEFTPDWGLPEIMMDGTFCVATIAGKPGFGIDEQRDIAGPGFFSIDEPSQFDRITFNPDGTCDWATFVLTDLPLDTEVDATHVGHIINVIVDGRTGECWFQRAYRTEEVELLVEELHADPLLRQDFTKSVLLTEDNVNLVHEPDALKSSRGAPTGGQR